MATEHKENGCQVHINVEGFVLYPEFAVSEGERETLNNWKLRCLQQEKLERLRKKVAANQPVKISMKYFVSLPMESAHSGHPTGLSAIFAQNLHHWFPKRYWRWSSQE